MNKKDNELKRFEDILMNIVNLIDDYQIKVYSYSEMGISENAVLKTYGTNHGQITLETKFSGKNRESTYTVRFNLNSATVKVNRVADQEAERMYDDVGEDLKSLFHDSHFDRDDVVEYDDMSGDE